MARITVEDCLDVVDNRFELVVLASRRARQLAKGAEPTIDNSEHEDKPTVLALREIAAPGASGACRLQVPRPPYRPVKPMGLDELPSGIDAYRARQCAPGP